MRKGEAATADAVRGEKKTTQPPSRFAEASLIRAMMRIAARVEDDKAKKRLKKTSDIGTPATRAAIIETLEQRDLIRVRKRKVEPTDIGMELIAALELAVPSYADPAVTAQWEEGLEMIATATLTTREFVDAIAAKVRKDVVRIRDREGLPTVGGPMYFTGLAKTRLASLLERPVACN